MKRLSQSIATVIVVQKLYAIAMVSVITTNMIMIRLSIVEFESGTASASCRPFFAIHNSTVDLTLKNPHSAYGGYPIPSVRRRV